MSDETTPGPDLRERIAQALTREHYRRAELRIEASPEEHQAAFADVVMAVLRAHAAEIDPADLRTPIASVLRSAKTLRMSNEQVANAIRASVLDPFVIRLSEAVDEVVAAKDAEIERLTEERDQAIAHDQQPYPTASAYEQACKALHAHRGRADQAEATVARMRAFIEDMRTWCSPHGVVVGYADRLLAELDRSDLPAVREFAARLDPRGEEPR